MNSYWLNLQEFIDSSAMFQSFNMQYNNQNNQKHAESSYGDQQSTKSSYSLNELSFCNLCAKSFRKPSSLARHKYEHSGNCFLGYVNFCNHIDFLKKF